MTPPDARRRRARARARAPGDGGAARRAGYHTRILLDVLRCFDLEIAIGKPELASRVAVQNVFDLAHFVTVHHFQNLPSAELRVDGAHADAALDGIASLPGRPKARTRARDLSRFRTIPHRAGGKGARCPGR